MPRKKDLKAGIIEEANSFPTFKFFQSCQGVVQDYDSVFNTHFEWLNEILEACKKTFATDYVQLLPKTPSARKTRPRNLKRQDANTVSYATKSVRSISDDCRKTRSAAAKCNIHNTPKAATIPVLAITAEDEPNLDDMVAQNLNAIVDDDDNKDGIESEIAVETSTDKTSSKSANASKLSSSFLERTPVKSPTLSCKSVSEADHHYNPRPIEGFGKMSVKEKAQAYDERVTPKRNAVHSSKMSSAHRSSKSSRRSSIMRNKKRLIVETPVKQTPSRTCKQPRTKALGNRSMSSSVDNEFEKSLNKQLSPKVVSSEEVMSSEAENSPKYYRTTPRKPESRCTRSKMSKQPIQEKQSGKFSGVEEAVHNQHLNVPSDNMRCTRSKLRNASKTNPPLTRPREKRTMASDSEDDVAPARKAARSGYSSSDEVNFTKHRTARAIISAKKDTLVSNLSKRTINVLPNLVTGVRSFIRAETPKKMDPKAKEELKKREMEEKTRKAEEQVKKLEQAKRIEIEERKRKREERMKLVAQRREEAVSTKLTPKTAQSRSESVFSRLREQRARDEEKRRKDKRDQEYQELGNSVELEKKTENEHPTVLDSAASQATEMLRQNEEIKAKEDQKAKEEEAMKQQQLVAEKLAREERVRQLAYEQQRAKELQLAKERQLAEEQKRAKEKELLAAKQRELVEREKKEQELKERQRLEAEKLQAEKLEKERQQREEIKRMEEKRAAQQTLNTSVQSYDMTPVRIHKTINSNANNYNIEDLRSDDSTDDEEQPRKIIPSWAQGSSLRASLIQQNYNPPNLDEVFNSNELLLAPDLNAVFPKQKKKRFDKRTSSAVWTTPMLKPSGEPITPYQ